MMISLTDLLLGINSAFIIGLCVHYFKSNYTIMDMETYNNVCDICEEYTAMVQEKEQMDDGGSGGFFREYLEEELDEDEEDPEEEEEDSKQEEAPKKKRGRKAKTENKKVGF